MSQKNRSVKGIYIPINVWSDKRMSCVEKMILAEVDSLDDGVRHCFASNGYLADFLGISVSTVQRALSALLKLGYIKITPSDGAKPRVIESLMSSQNDLTHHGQNDQKQGQNDLTPHGQNDLYSNIPSLRDSIEVNREYTGESREGDKSPSLTDKKTIANPSTNTLSLDLDGGYEGAKAPSPISPPPSPPPKKRYGEFGSVLLSDAQHATLTERYRDHDVAAMIAKLDKYCAAKGRKYKNYFAVLTDWVARDLNITERQKYFCVKCKKPHYNPRAADKCCLTGDELVRWEARYGS